MIATCREGDIVVPGFDTALPREKLTALVVALDMIIMIVFVSYIYGVKACIKKEGKDFDIETVTLTDFALRFKHLPPKSEYETPAQLKAMLTLHLNKLIADQEQQIQRLSQSEVSPDEFVQPSDIASIHFGYNNFEDYDILIKIMNLAKKGTHI